jgi:predicted component of type VI protein secretion system
MMQLLPDNVRGMRIWAMQCRALLINSVLLLVCWTMSAVEKQICAKSAKVKLTAEALTNPNVLQANGS